jgi:A/G-specific adenine glycosylase
MDLGSQVCARRTPRCGACPVQDRCVARREARIDALPSPRPARLVPRRRTAMLILSREGHQVLLERRPAPGVWGGLWCFPEVEEDTLLPALQRYGADPDSLQRLREVQHAFTHFRLTITPLLAHVCARSQAEEPGRLWLSQEDALGAAIPAPVRKILSLIARP